MDTKIILHAFHAFFILAETWLKHTNYPPSWIVKDTNVVLLLQVGYQQYFITKKEWSERGKNSFIFATDRTILVKAF